MNKYFEKIISKLKINNNFRNLKDRINTRINLSSNDYLGLSNNIDIRKEFNNTILDKDFLYSSTSSRLLEGNHKYYKELENKLEFNYKRKALVFNSGYHINIGILPCLTTKEDLIISDKLVHSSIIDGIKLSNAKTFRYKHLDYEGLENYLSKNRDKYKNIFIVTESLFSMDGDIVDLNRIVKIKNKYNCFLYLDEAHSVGTYGKKGLGICEENNLINEVDFIVGTFGKAFCSLGAFVICDEVFKDILINKSKSFIYTTALPPINVAWTSFIFDKIIKMEEEREYLKDISNDLRNHLKSKGYEVLGESNIIPIMKRGNKNCTKYSELLKKDKGIKVFPIKNPTILIGEERVRLSVHSNLTKKNIEIIKNIL